MGWTNFRYFIKSSFNISWKLWLIYAIVFFVSGMLMNEFGKWAEIARFSSWWQVITAYVLYMVPIAVLLRNLPWHGQYAYGLIAMGVLEFLGYALETSIAYPDNILDRWFNIRNFSLSMTLFFAAYFPIGNAIVHWLARKIFGKEVAQGQAASKG